MYLATLPGEAKTLHIRNLLRNRTLTSVRHWINPFYSEVRLAIDCLYPSLPRGHVMMPVSSGRGAFQRGLPRERCHQIDGRGWEQLGTRGGFSFVCIRKSTALRCISRVCVSLICPKAVIKPKRIYRGAECGDECGFVCAADVWMPKRWPGFIGRSGFVSLVLVGARSRRDESNGETALPRGEKRN